MVIQPGRGGSATQQTRDQVGKCHARGDRARIPMRDDRGQRGVQPECGTGARRVQQHDGCDAHQRAVTGTFRATAVPRRHSLGAILQEPGHGLANAENRSRGEAGRKILRVQPPMFEQTLECPESELAVVRWESYTPAAGVLFGR